MRYARLWSSMVAVALALVVGAVFILWAGKSPVVAYQALWSGSFGSIQDFGEMLVSMTPLVFTGLAVAFAYRCGLFNIGVEGQFIVGQLGAAWAGYAITGLPAVLHVPSALLFGAAAGAIWAGIPGYLKAKLGVHEVINTIMLNYIALYFTHYLVIGPLKGHPFLPVTKEILPSAVLWHFLPPTRANIGILVALLCAVIVYVILWKTRLGYEVRAVGHSQDAAEYAGISVGRSMVMAMLISGALAGMGGAVQVLGLQLKFYDVTSFTGYGFDGIAVALIGNLHPAGVVVAAALFGILARAGMMMQSLADVPKEVIGIVSAAIIVFAVIDFSRIFGGRKLKVPAVAGKGSDDGGNH